MNEQTCTYFLLKDFDSGIEYNFLKFGGVVVKNEIQNEIWQLEHEFEKKKDDTGFVDGMFEIEYIIYKLQEKYDVEILWDSEEGKLYC